MCNPCPVVALARRGNFGDDFRRRKGGPQYGGPQCDSYELLEAMLREIVGATPHDAASHDEHYVAKHGVRTILQDAVFGFLTRDRSRCTNAACLAVHDSLHNDELVLKLNFPDKQSRYFPVTFPDDHCDITLRDMWEYHFGEQLAERRCAHCQNEVKRQCFL